MSLHASHSSPRPHLSDTWPELPHYPPAELPYESYPPFYAPCMSIFSSHYTDSAPEVTNPFIFAETKHDFRAPSIDARRFRAHLYRYGYKRRSAKHVRTSLTEVLSSYQKGTHTPFPHDPSAVCSGSRQLAHRAARETWRWIGYRCSCCWCSTPHPHDRSQEAWKLARREMARLRKYPEWMTKGRGWDDDRTLEPGERWRSFRGDPVWEEDLRRYEGEDERAIVWDGNAEAVVVRKTMERGQDGWASLVDRAVGKWERKRRRAVEGLGWEVYSESEKSYIEDEWVDWNEVDERKNEEGGRKMEMEMEEGSEEESLEVVVGDVEYRSMGGDGESICGWTECPSDSEFEDN